METIPKTTDIELDSLAELAIDSWRLSRWINTRQGDESMTVPRHVLRRILRFLQQNEISTVDLTGQTFDPGLAAEVIDAEQDQTLPQDAIQISETISPIVMWRNIAVKHAQIAVKQNTRPDDTRECKESDQ